VRIYIVPASNSARRRRCRDLDFRRSPRCSAQRCAIRNMKGLSTTDTGRGRSNPSEKFRKEVHARIAQPDQRKDGIRHKSSIREAWIGFGSLTTKQALKRVRRHSRKAVMKKEGFTSYIVGAGPGRSGSDHGQRAALRAVGRP
jgi:hypothetical protein